jgi:hypothetical protein
LFLPISSTETAEELRKLAISTDDIRQREIASPLPRRQLNGERNMARMNDQQRNDNDFSPG